MKRVSLIVPLLLVAGLALAQDQGGAPGAGPSPGRGPVGMQRRGPGAGPRPNAGPRQGPAMNHPSGPGLIGIGIMPMGPNGPLVLHPALQKLPEDKQTQLRKLHTDAMQSVERLVGDLRAKGQVLSEAMRQYPLDKAGVKKQQEGVKKLQDQIFTLHMDTLAQAQKYVDKETWETLMKGPPMGFGPGGPGPRPGAPGAPGAGPRGPAK